MYPDKTAEQKSNTEQKTSFPFSSSIKYIPSHLIKKAHNMLIEMADEKYHAGENYEAKSDAEFEKIIAYTEKAINILLIIPAENRTSDDIRMLAKFQNHISRAYRGFDIPKPEDAAMYQEAAIATLMSIVKKTSYDTENLLEWRKKLTIDYSILSRNGFPNLDYEKSNEWLEKKISVLKTILQTENLTSHISSLAYTYETIGSNFSRLDPPKLPDAISYTQMAIETLPSIPQYAALSNRWKTNLAYYQKRIDSKCGKISSEGNKPIEPKVETEVKQEISQDKNVDKVPSSQTDSPSVEDNGAIQPVPRKLSM